MTKPGKAALARARRLYEAGDVPLGRIAEQLHMSPAAFRALRKREQWPPRAGDQPAPKAPAPDQDEGSLDTRALERRLVRALRREIARAEGFGSASGGTDKDNPRRTLSVDSLWRN